MLTLDPRWLAASGNGFCDTVAAAMGLAGPHDFLPLKSETLKDIFDPRRDSATTQPIHYADGKNAPPMLLISGETERTVRSRNSKRLAA